MDSNEIEPIEGSFDDVASAMVINPSADLSAVMKAEFGSADNLLKIGEVSVECYVLEDGTRVLSGRGMQESIGPRRGGNNPWVKTKVFFRFKRHKTLCFQ